MESFELTDQELSEYIDVALSNADRVGPEARHQLHGLLRYYAKKKHPFTACVRDNTKRFGPDRAKRVCAVLKDIIRGTTKWRGKNNPRDKGVSAAALSEEFALNLDETLQHELDEELTMMEIPEEKLEFAAGDVAWDHTGGEEYLREMLNNALNEHDGNEGDVADYGQSYWVRDTNEKDSTALVCQGGDTYWVVPYSMDKKGNFSISDESEWKHVQPSWVETNLSDEPQLLAEMYFDNGDMSSVKVEDDIIWKPILREGVWKYSPGPGGVPIDKPIKVVKTGRSSGATKTVSIEELKNNFDAGIMENVTIPETHDDKSTENTGFIRGMRIGQDENGRAILEAGFDFTEPDVKDKVKRGTIANTSAGILFDYIHKEKGTKHNAVVAHAALTNHPWLNGMKPFGVQASENIEVVAFSEENNTSPNNGGERMSDKTTEEATEVKEEKTQQPDPFAKLGLSEDEVAARLKEYDELKKSEKRHSVDTQIKEWQDDGVPPAVLTEAKAAMMADGGEIVMHLSEDGADKPLTLTQYVERIVASIPKIDLTEDHSGGEAGSSNGERPADDANEENKYADLSLAEKTEITNMVLYERVPEEDAVAEVRARRDKK